MSNARNLASAGATAAGGLAPTGVVLPFAGSAAPTGWLLCDGSAVSRTTYAALFTAIGTTYGSGNGTSTFNLPDLGGRVPAGKEASATRLTTAGSGINGATLGSTGGAETHTLDVNQIPAHNHPVGDSAGGTGSATGGGKLFAGTGSAGTTANRGGGQAHNNTQPTIVLNYIIKT